MWWKRPVIWLRVGVICSLWGSGTGYAIPPGSLLGVTLGPRATILIFVASHCPCTDAHRQHVDRLIDQHAGNGVRFYTIFANGDETPDRIAHMMKGLGWAATPVHDRDGTLLAALGAKTTPHAFVLDAKGTLVYEGAIDDSVPNMGQILHPYLRTAVEQLLAGHLVEPAHTSPYGCYILRKDRGETFQN